MEGAPVTVHAFIDGDPETYDGPTQAEIPYSDLDGDTLFELAMQGDQGAVAYLNGEIEDPEDIDHGMVNEKGQIMLPPIAVPSGLAPGDTVTVEWAEDDDSSTSATKASAAAMPEIHVHIEAPAPSRAPDVHVTMPPITVEAPNVDVQAPEVHVHSSAPKPQPPRRRVSRAKREDDGSVTVTSEEAED